MLVYISCISKRALFVLLGCYDVVPLGLICCSHPLRPVDSKWIFNHNQFCFLYIYIGRQKCQRCNAFFAAALLCWQKYIKFIFCCSAAISLAADNYQCHMTGWLYYQIAAAQWRMVHFGTPRVDPIHTPNIGSIDGGLISISAMESHPYSSVKIIKAHDISYDGTTTK